MSANDYDRVARAIRFLDEHGEEQPGLAEVAAAAGLSASHFQRLFRRWAGVSPKRYLQRATAARARAELDRSADVLETAYAAGLSGPGRLHDLFVNVWAATPAQVRERGAGLEVRVGFAPTPFGEALVATTARGLCALEFLDGGREAALERLRSAWGRASLVADDAGAASICGRIFAAARRSRGEPLTLHLTGSNFQLRVWEALLRIPPARTSTYEALAAGLGAAGAARAVGCAVGANPIAFVIPCHRVLRKSGALGGYRWGLERKRTMLAWETARALTASE